MSGTPAILRWFRSSENRKIVASQYFDSDFYEFAYSDVATSDLGSYEHYLCFGEHEQRQPNALFNPVWYDQVADRAPEEGGMSAHAHFVTFGIERGAAPCAALLSVFARTATARLKPSETYGRVMAVTAPWFHTVGVDQTHLALQLFNPDIYDANGSLTDNASGMERLEHFLRHGLRGGLDPSPLFSSTLYAQRAGLTHDGAANPLLHFLEFGRTNHIVPTNLFDPAAYENAWPDIKVARLWGFGHFVAHGIYEGRKINGAERVGQWALPFDTVGGQLHNWELFWSEALAGESSSQPPIVRQAGSFFAKVDAQHLPMLKGLFCAPYYAAQAGLDPKIGEDGLFQHYVETGFQSDLAPGPLFDPAMARALVGKTDEPVIIAWLNQRQDHWRAPTRFFDKKYYLSYYAGEFEGMALDLFQRYVLHGLHENRLPNAIFDPVWYASAYSLPESERGLPAYLHYLLHGADRGLAPSQLLLTTYSMPGKSRSSGLENLVAIDQSIGRWHAKLDSHRIQVMLAMFSPYQYDGGGILPESASGVDRLLDFLDRGLEAGVVPSPLFDASSYDMTAMSGDVPFLHYLRQGWSRRIVPTAIYSETSYQRTHADIRQHNLWGFRHFLFHGLYEGRKVDETARLTVFVDTSEPASRQLNNARLFWGANGAPSARLGLPSRIEKQQERLNIILKSDVYANSVKRALQLDPAIGDIKKGQGYHAPPSHEPAFPAILKLHDRIANRKYGTIICVPWLRTGGADLVACQLATACRKANPDENVLILRVDQENFERPEWVSDDVDIAHISDILRSLPDVTAERLLYVMFKSLEPKRVINVNSYRTWRTMERFGKRLRTHINLYSYMFCWDQTKDGYRVGYPSLFFPSTASVLTGIFTDTQYLKNELTRIYNAPRKIMDRVRPLYTPSRTLPPAKTYARTAIEGRTQRRARILWAGRLDIQKRFDLVQQIARKMPDVDFLCWGDAVLDAPPDHSASPQNLVLRPGFKSYSELPMDDVDLWLFTSAWEGMPTILIEIAVRGMAVVASQVGGVPELIDHDTGYPVEDAGSVDAYVDAIRQALDDPKQRMERADRLMAKAVRRYSQDSYVEDLRAIFAEEKQ